MDDYVEIAWMIGMPKFRKLARRLGLSIKDLECIAHDIQFFQKIIWINK